MPNGNNENTFEFKYEGKFDSLDASIVLNSQLNFINILNEVRRQHCPEVELSIRIEGVNKGSLEINHLIDVVGATGIFLHENYKYIEDVITIFTDIIKLKRFLKSSKADSVKASEGNNVTVNINGDGITVHEGAIRIYQNSTVVNNSLNNTSKLLKQAEEVECLEIINKDKGKKYLEFKKEEFSILGESNPYLDKTNDVQVSENQVLYIKKPNLFPIEGKKWVWELIHRGRDIKAIIVDESFRDRINKGLKVGQGDRLRADLKIHYKFDERLNTLIESQKFEVLNISEIIERSQEPRLEM